MADNVEASGNRNGADVAEAAPVSGLEHVRYFERESVGLLTIDRPNVHNAISLATMAELERVLDWLEKSSRAEYLP